MIVTAIILGYLLVFALLNWLILATSRGYDSGASCVETWLILSFVWPIGVALYFLRLVFLLPKAVYERARSGHGVWWDYFVPWSPVLW